MKLNFIVSGQSQILDLQGDDLPEMILTAMQHCEQQFPDIAARADFPVLLCESFLNGLALDHEEIAISIS